MSEEIKTDGVEETVVAAEQSLDYAGAMELLNGIEFEGKDSIISGIKSGISARNEESKNYRESEKQTADELQAVKNNMNKLTEEFRLMTGKEVNLASEIDVKTFSKEITDLKTNVENIQAERDAAKQEVVQQKLTTAIYKEISKNNVLESSKEDVFNLLSNKYVVNSSGEFVTKDGEKIEDNVKGFLDSRPNYIKSKAIPGAGLQKADVNLVDSNSAEAQVANAISKIRMGRK